MPTFSTFFLSTEKKRNECQEFARVYVGGEDVYSLHIINGGMMKGRAWICTLEGEFETKNSPNEGGGEQ